MDFKKWLFEMKNTRYDFSSTHVNVPDPLASEIIAWGKKTIPDSSIYESDSDNVGRENEMHVTVLYGIHSEYPNKTKKCLNKNGAVKVKLGKVNIFPNPKFDVVVIDVISDDLDKANKKLTEKIPFTNKYEAYRPHITVAYVKKGKGEEFKDIDKWEGKEFKCNHIVFSSKNGAKDKIKL